VSKPAPPPNRSPVAAWETVTSWVKGAARNPRPSLAFVHKTAARQSTLVISAMVLLVVAVAAPVPHSDVVDSVQVSVAFFATLLTGEAVIFALSFSVSSAWPSLREIDRHIAFREWVVTGWVASMPAAIGLLTNTAIPATFGALLFVLADVFGMFSFVRLFGLASAGGRKRLLCRTLGDALAAEPVAAAGLARRISGDRVLGAYLGELDQAAARSDGNGVQDLAGQLVEASGGFGGRAGGERAVSALHLEVIHRLVKAALVGKLDPVVASAAADILVGSVLDRAGEPREGGNPGQEGGQLAAAVMGQLSRYLAWLASTSLTLSARQVTSAGAARELVALSVRARQRILRLVDPDPPYAAGVAELGTQVTDPAGVLAWIADFTEWHGAHQAAGMYPVYEILTGKKFLGNYWDGDSVLAGLREALYDPADLGRAEVASAAKRAFGTTSGFDRVWTLISAGAIATLRDVRMAHPPELIRPEFTPDPQLLGAYVRTFASHRYFTTAAEAARALAAVVGCAGAPGSLWERVHAVRACSGWVAPMPVVEPHRRLSACVLAIAARLAPLAAGEPDRELRAFLAGLPQPVLEATARLASRVLPGAVASSERQPGEHVVEGLRVVQLVGTDRGSGR
jgi:hypothetical protein